MLWEYVAEHTNRGACLCGRCIDSPEDPGTCQPDGHVVDMVFFKVGMKGNPIAEEFTALVQEEFPEWLDGNERSYIALGADIGDQSMAMSAMALGHLLRVWKVLSPTSLGFPLDVAMELVGRGLLTMRAHNST